MLCDRHLTTKRHGPTRVVPPTLNDFTNTDVEVTYTDDDGRTVTEHATMSAPVTDDK